MSEESRDYELVGKQNDQLMAEPTIDYLPPKPKKSYKIGLIGCGGITDNHLQAYRDAGWEVVAFADLSKESAQKKKAQYYPNAQIFTDYHDLLSLDSIDIVDIATHPEIRGRMIRDALEAGKHVLSQKPFVKDLSLGRELIALAKDKGLKLAVNQNGRFAPYVRYIKQVIAAGILGEVQSVSMNLNWDHTWTLDTPFNEVHHLVLYDFGIHWHDMVNYFLPQKKLQSVCAFNTRISAQKNKPPLLGSVLVQFEEALATIHFDAGSIYGSSESIMVAGSRGTIKASGGVVACDKIELFTEEGFCMPALSGKWFNDGFMGSMGELMCAVEENREPANGAVDNLRSLEICFGAMKSSDEGSLVSF